MIKYFIHNIALIIIFTTMIINTISDFNWRYMAINLRIWMGETMLDDGGYMDSAIDNLSLHSIHVFAIQSSFGMLYYVSYYN